MNSNWLFNLKQRALLVAPYVLALALPGGTIAAVLLWFFRGRHKEA